MIAQKNVTHIVVGKDDDLATSSETRDDLIAGQIGVFKVGSTTATTSALAAGERFQIVYKRVDGAVINSPVISYSNTSDKKAVLYSAAVVASKALGFNGTTGSIDVSNSDVYTVHYKYYDDGKTYGRSKPLKFVTYQSSASATQAEIALGLAKNFALNATRENMVNAFSPLAVKAVINNAGAVITGTGNITANYGSKYMVAATDVDAVLNVGDYFRLGTAAGAAVTDDVYKVVSLDTTNEIIEVDRPFQGTSATYTEANCDYIAAATAATADAGVIFTAQTAPFKAGKLYYSPVYFDFGLISEAFGTTTVTDPLTTASKGKGTYSEIAEVEWFLRGNRGEPYRVAEYPVDYTPDAISGKTYDQISFNYFDDNAQSLDYNPKSFGSILIATENESASTVHTDLKTVLGIS